MSKVIPVMFAGLGTAAIATGGAFLVKNGSSSAASGTGGDNPAASKTDNGISDTLSFSTLAEFKSNSGGGCAKRHFPSFNYETTGKSTLGDSETIDASYFSPDSEGNENSCLVINWERTDSSAEGSDPKPWKGTFRWLWSFVKGNRGFVAFNSYSPSTEEHKMAVEGGLYFIERTDSNSA